MNKTGGNFMAYSIVEYPATSFIDNRSIQLPRFQRKQTWKADDNFKLCISVFKGYPIGVVIINTTLSPEPTDWLLDGRQRRNALIEMRTNPVSVYQWAQKFVKFKNNDSEQQLKDKFFASIDSYLQNEDKTSYGEENNESDDSEFYTDDLEEQSSSFDSRQQYASLIGLFDLISIVHPVKNKKTRLENMFLFDGIIPISDLDYSIRKNGEDVIDISRLWSFVKVCVNEGYNTVETFTSYLIKRYKLKDEPTIRKITIYIERHWEEYYSKCLKTLSRCEQTLQNSTLGLIKLTNASPLDAQNLFSLVNNGGTKLSAEELLSARPFWNTALNNPSLSLKDNVKKLYNKLGISVPDEVYRWDLCASLLLQIDRNHLVFEDMPFSDLEDKVGNQNFQTTLSIGFKLTSAILAGGINNRSVNQLEKKKINWDIEIDKMASDINTVICILEDYDYFKYLKSWNQSIMSLTSNSIALEFMTIMYLRWKNYYNCPTKSSSTAKNLQNEAFILLDRLIYEYSIRIWSGSSDNRLASDIQNIQSRITAVSQKEWITLINELATGKYKDKLTKVPIVKPLIYHYYCMKKMTPTLMDIHTTYEVDHIVAQNLFSNVTNDGIISKKDCILNLALLPKGDNITKSDQKLNVIKAKDPWLTDQIKKYAGISDGDMDILSDVSNVKHLDSIRLPQWIDAFSGKRDSCLMS